MKFIFVSPVFIVAALLLNSCNSVIGILPNPYHFSLNRITPDVSWIGGTKMCNLDSVDILNDNSIRLFPGGRVALASGGVTDFIADFSVALKSGSGIKFYLCTGPRYFGKIPHVAVEFSKKEMIVEESGIFTAHSHAVALDTSGHHRIQIFRDGRQIEIQYDCNTVWRGESSLPNSEYVLVESRDRSIVDVYGVSITEIRSGSPSKTMKKIAKEIANRPVSVVAP